MFNSNQSDPNQHLGVLPTGWEMIFDHKTGWPYFVDHNTQTTSWEDPRLNPAFNKMQFPSSGFNSPSMGSDQKMREIPVMHESPRHPAQQHPGSQWQQQYPQSRTPPRVNTPPRVGTPPRTEGAAGTPPRFYTLPRNHKERANETVREIPIQHFSSRAMSPGRQQSAHQQSPQQQSYPDRSVPNPDYPGAQSQTSSRYPPQQYSATLPRTTGHAQTFPSHSAPQQYPQSYPQQGYPQQSHGYPQGQGYMQRPAGPHPQGPSMPQPPPVSQAPYYQQGQQQPYPGQHPRPPMPQPQGHQPSPPPASQPQCRPPEVQQEVYNIPIIRETEKRPNPPSEPHSRPYTPDRQTQPQNQQYGNKESRHDEGNRTREGSYDHMDAGEAGANTNNNGQKREPTSSNQNYAQEQPKQKPRTPLDDIRDILEGCKQYEDRVMTFSGTKKDKEYKLLEEMMTRGILKLDGIESGSDINIRQARKAAVHEIQSYLDQLELKAFSAGSSKDGTQTMNGGNGNTSSDSQAEAMDTSSANENKGKNVKEMVLDSEVQC